MRPWRLEEKTFRDIQAQDRPADLAVLPLGATEPHNFHLPYGTDTFQVMAVADLACAAAMERGARIILLPPIPYGTESNLQAFPLAMNLQPSTLGAVITDLVATLERSGVQKLLLLNGHGGNDLKWLQRELFGLTEVHIFVCHWYRVAKDHLARLFVDPGDHAGELETSMALEHFSEHVRMSEADPTPPRTPRFNAIREGWIEITRPWHLLTDHTGVGDPTAATAEKGRELTAVTVARLADFLVDLAKSPVDEQFPF
jgi:creatinine amidohydrolase